MDKKEQQILRFRKQRFNKLWKFFVIRMNSGKKPLILRLFGSRFPTDKVQKPIAMKFFDDGFYEGAMYMAEQIPIKNKR